MKNQKPTNIEDIEQQFSYLRERYKETLLSLQRQLEVEEQLLASQQRFKTVFHSSIVACKIIDPELKIIETNQALCDLLGYSRDEILGTTILDYTHPDFIKHWYDLHEALWSRRLPFFTLEVCLLRKDQSLVWCLINTVRFEDKDETLGYSSMQNITERKQLERHKDEFVSMVSHELKTPITSIKAYCQLLQKRFSKSDDSVSAGMLDKMEKKIDGLTELIKELVLASKIERRKLDPVSTSYKLNSVIEDTVNEFRQTVSNRQIILDANPEVTITGDPQKIGQVINNLLTNALKFSPETTPIIVRSELKDGDIVVSVKDFGIGIPEHSLEIVFDRFYKIKEADSNLESGMGLGLYISKEIIKNQHGKIWAESRLNEGSTFCFSLPVAVPSHSSGQG